MTQRSRVWLLALVLMLAGTAVYANSVDVPFIFDDEPHIVENRQIERLWPPWQLLGDSFRPVLKLTLAANYAIGGRDPAGYHLVNAAIHVLAAWLLFGVVRRCAERVVPGRDHTAFAFLAALLWMLHPLQTQAVTYTIQRGESLMGLFYLLTLYAAIRSAASGHPVAWGALAVASCTLGMGTKSVMVTAPIAVLLYDASFLAGSLRGALARRWPLYLALAASWGVLLGVVGLRFLGVDQSAGFGLERVRPLEYLATQPGVVLHYLRLSLWPDPLCFDYDWPVAHGWREIAVPALVVSALLASAVGAWLRGRWWGFVALWFFLVLAPTSSIMPINDLAVEHRMYLPLAAVVIVGLAAGSRGLVDRGRGARALGVALALAVAAVFAVASVRRNQVYRDPVALWRGVTELRPDNSRAFLSLGTALSDRGEHEAALASYRRALRLRPDDAAALYSLANELLALGRPEEAIASYQAVLELRPESAGLLTNLGVALRRAGRPQEALSRQWRAVRLAPGSAKVHRNLGHTLAAVGQLEAATVQYREAVRLEPGSWAAHNDLAWLLATQPGLRPGAAEEALVHARRAVELSEGLRATALDTLATAQAATGDFVSALDTAGRAGRRAHEQGDVALAEQIEARRARFAAGEPWTAAPPAQPRRTPWNGS